MTAPAATHRPRPMMPWPTTSDWLLASTRLATALGISSGELVDATSETVRDSINQVRSFGRAELTRLRADIKARAALADGDI